MHLPNWRKLSDIKDDNRTWTAHFTSFLASAYCPNFLKAEVDRVKSHANKAETVAVPLDEEESSDIASSQPEWVELVKPFVTFDDIQREFTFDDGGPDYDWSFTSLAYPYDLGLSWIETLAEASGCASEELNLPNVDISMMNEDQRFAFNIAI